MEMTTQRTIEIIDYDPEWPGQFDALSAAITGILGHFALRVEHVGSTSIPGLAAKPIIDLTVVIPTRELLTSVILLLNSLGYEPEGDCGIPGREAFDRANAEVPRDGIGTIWPAHHLYVCDQDNTELARHLAFRDYLRSHPEQAIAYGNLKRDLAQRFPHDIDSYCEGKTELVEGILMSPNMTASGRLTEK